MGLLFYFLNEWLFILNTKKSITNSIIITIENGFFLVFLQNYFRRCGFNFQIKIINKLEIHFKIKNELEIWVWLHMVL